MPEKYHDVMAICRWYGNPDLFVTMTTNPKWVEISNHLQMYGTDDPNDRPDLECRVFKMKSLVEQHMMHGPCGKDRSTSPCMDNGVCTKKFPRSFVPHTQINESGYVLSACESMWRIFKFDVHHNSPAVQKFPVHLLSGLR